MTIVAGCTVETVTECSIVIQTGVGSGWTRSWDVRSGWTVGAGWTHVLILGGARVVTVPTSTTVSCARRKIKAISIYFFNINFQVSTNISICFNDFYTWRNPISELLIYGTSSIKYKLNMITLSKSVPVGRGSPGVSQYIPGVQAEGWEEPTGQ